MLPRDLARAVALHYIAGLSVRSIADRLSRPEGTVKRWLHEGRSRLAVEMEGYAPMERQITATILHTDLTEDTLDQIAGYLKTAGFTALEIVTDIDAVSVVVEEGVGEYREFHMADRLRGSRLFILDEWIGGRSAFELHTILKATAEARDIGFCLLLGSPKHSTLFAAWAAGFDLCFSKDHLDSSFQDCVRRWLQLDNGFEDSVVP